MAMQEPENLTDAPGLQRVDALRRQLAEDPRSVAFVSLAEELNRIGEHEEAATVAQRGLLTHPDSVAGRLALAVAESERENVKEALEQIKRALIIDQENPKALALMGRILLKRGLAKRAVQFLSHAVKLAPTEREYGQLLQQARRSASDPGGSGPPPPPVFNADAVQDKNDPWTQEPGQQEAEHTVFDPDAIKKMSRGATSLRAAQDAPAGEEPTAFQFPMPQPGAAAARQAKMGGSAAEYSQMVHRSELIGGTADAPRVAPRAPSLNMPDADASSNAQRASKGAGRSGSALPSTSGPSGDEPDSAREAGSRVSQSSNAKAGSSESARNGNGRRPSFRAKSAAKGKGVKKDGESKAVSSAPSNGASGAPDKRVGPAATRMVDDALWVLFGNKKAVDADQVEEEQTAGPAPESERPAPVRARLRGHSSPARPHAPRVVRTSEQFATWAQIATMTVLSVAGAFIGHWVLLSSAGPSPEVASEEVKGLASDLERGGLAALLAAEEKANALSRSAPDLAPLLSSVQAEIYARRWRAFGRDSTMRERAQASIDDLKGRRPTVEHLAGLVALSTSAQQREPILEELRRLERQYPESPKIRVLQAKLHRDAGRERAALNSLFEARAIHKTHRLTMLELARWYLRSGAHGAALSSYASLLEAYPLDVEAAIERYVLGQATGADPDAAQAVSILAGLVRNEDPAVAKDETGRASLAFAIPLLAAGQLVEGIEELGKAEAAFEQSAVFKHAVAGAYLAVGELDRAEALYKAAIALEPKARAPKVGLARVQYARAAGIKVDRTLEAEKIAKRFKARKKEDGIKFARLPLGALRLVPGRFEIVRFLPSPSIFPETAYRKAKDAETLRAINLTALGERLLAEGKARAAAKRFEAALGERPTPSARFGLGRAQLALGRVDEAARTLRAGVIQAPEDVPGRLALSRALRAQGKTVQALDVLEVLDRSTVVAPDGLYWLGRLRLERGDYEGALSPLKTVVELKPDDVEAQMAYGEALHHQGRADEALAAFGQAADLDRKIGSRRALSPVALMYLGRAELKRSSRDGVALLKRALKHDDVPTEAQFYLGRHQVRARRTRREGRRRLDRFVRASPASEMRDEARRLLRRR